MTGQPLEPSRRVARSRSVGRSRSVKPSRPNEGGQGRTEYLIILALIAIAAIGVLSYFGRETTRQPPGGAITEAPARPAGPDAARTPAKAPEGKAAGPAKGAAPDRSPDK